MFLLGKGNSEPFNGDLTMPPSNKDLDKFFTAAFVVIALYMLAATLWPAIKGIVEALAK